MNGTGDRSRHYAAVLVASVLATLALAGEAAQEVVLRRSPQGNGVYRPQLAVPETLAPFLEHLDAANDSFPEEQQAVEIEARLRELSDSLRGAPSRTGGLERFLAADFHGGRLLPLEGTTPPPDSPFEVRRAVSMPQELSLDSRAFGIELRRLLEDIRELTVTEFLITSIESAQPSGLVRTEVRYDIVGVGIRDWRVERVGGWRMTWRKAASGWQVVQWTAASDVESRAKSPVFTEITQAALGANDSFKRQLGTDLDTWMATIDSVLTRDSNGHHGVSVGDADGDGREDLYVAQPAGLPNRLYRARGDGTFEDVTERAGVGVLDDTSQSLFVDVDNDGDQDLVLATATKPLLFINDGKGHFSNLPDVFRFQRPLQGVLTSIAMADYDRDGFLDLYLCVYSYFFGAGEDKAGTPMPYYDARNGPPGVLFRNDGHGHFVEVTQEAGLDVGNDRYHFAAAWADYDGDGWPDLLVANDFGTKNLYHNRGLHDGKVTFEDVAATAGVLDYGAGMSAAFFDYDNDGFLDIYTGNMWSASGLRVTSAAAFLNDASPDVRALFHRHARGNSLFRNRGDGRFEDKTIEAHAEMGRWAWSSDALDFDNDGWEDLYVVNGMLTRDRGSWLGVRGSGARNAEARDLESFFWRQVVARSPLTRIKGTPYDDAWRGINQLLIHGSIASHQRNVFLRNDGHGGFDEVSGAVGLDLDQDGRSFAVLDIDRDGDADLVVMAARQAPQLRVFRNDFAASGTSLSIHLIGTASNRGAIGARVRIETDRLRRTKIVQAGSGFLSQHSKDLLFGLGPSTQVRKLTVDWPSGRQQIFTDVPISGRLRLVEGGAIEKEAFAPRDQRSVSSSGTPAPTTVGQSSAVPPPRDSWLYEPFPAPDFLLDDVRGQTRSLASLQGRPAILLLWSTQVSASRTALDALGKAGARLSQSNVGWLAIAVDPAEDVAKVRAAAPSGSTIVASKDVGLSYAILYRHLFMNRQDLPLPTALLLDAAGRVVKTYRERIDLSEILHDVGAIEAPAADRLTRAVPFPGTFYSPPGLRNYLSYGRELMDQGLEAAAIPALERAAQASPNPSTLYRLGTLLMKGGETARARSALERALVMQPDLAEASNDLGTLLARSGDLNGAIERFRAALAAAPDYPDALNNLGYALLLAGHDDEARALYEKALTLQPDFPEALNNLGLLFGRAGDLNRAERNFRDALLRRPSYGEAANNLALVLVARGETDTAIRLLQGFLEKTPQFEDAYVTLAKIFLKANRTREGIAVLERLLQRNSTHPVALELLRQYKGL